ncbi:hypothetical protein HY249_00415 [Candidatus Azambacteria bacterium]|nr:hypothetical protein [Candidatus Azambacteria bacterium]
MSIFQTIVNKYKDAKQKSLNKKEFKQALLQAVYDGKLTKEEIDELDKKKKDFGLSEKDVKERKARFLPWLLLSQNQTSKLQKTKSRNF